MVSERRGRGRAGGGREARRVARAEARPAIVPYVTRRVPVYDVMSADGLDLIERNAETILEEVGVEFRDDPEALALWRERRGQRRWAARQDPPRPRPQARHRLRSGGVRAARAQPRAQRTHRRPAHGVRAGLRPPVHPQPRRRTALRDDRRLPQLREAHLHVARPAPRRRHAVRAGRPTRQQAPPRHGLQPPALLRQAVHGVCHRPRARRGHRLDGEDRLWRRVRGFERGHHQPHQRELASGVGTRQCSER